MPNREFPCDHPAPLSLVTSVIRERLRREILALNNDDCHDDGDYTEVTETEEELTLEEEIKAIQELLPKEFEITGLELLASSTDGYSSDDCSYDSYGADSNPLAAARLENNKVQPFDLSDDSSPRSRNRVVRRISDLSSSSQLQRGLRPVGSPTRPLAAMSDHSSEGDSDHDDDEQDTKQVYGRQPIPYTSPKKPQPLQRRASDFTFDSCDTDMNSYANDSVEFKNMKKSAKMPKDHLDLKHAFSTDSVSYSSSLIETATINTGGFSRAA